MTNSSPIEVFISYSHKDERLVDRFRPHLVSLERQKIITSWYDAYIDPGHPFDEDIKKHLNRAKIILLLISPDFMASPYINDIEVKRAMRRHRSNDARVIPVILREVDWEGTSFGKLQALPRRAKPVVLWKDRDSAFRDVTDGIKKVANTLKHPPQESDALPIDYYFLNHTSFLRKEKQKEFQQRTGIPIDHYDIRVVVDSYWEGALDRIKRVKYILDPAYPEPAQVRTEKDRNEKFLLKELANGEYVLQAEVYLKDRRDPIHLQRYITLWKSGPELP